MSDTEQQAKATTPDDVVMEEEDAPITDGQEPVAAEETKESDDKAASSEKETASKSKSKTSQPAKKGNGTSSRKMAGKFAKAEAKEPGKFKIGDLVTGRVKGYPFWPAVVVDPETVPPKVAKLRPRSSNIVCIQYMTDGQYSWFPPTPPNVRPLPKHEIDAYLRNPDSKKTSGQLYQAYTTAAHPKEWLAEQDEIRAILAQGSASEEEAAEDEDELADDGEDGEPAAKSGNKRKRATADVKKPTKKETVSKKAKTEKAPAKKSARKEAADDEEPVSKKAPASKAANKKAPASSSKKAAAPTSAKETKESKEAKEDAGDDALANDPEASKVRDWRHKLQRAFLSKSVPAADEMDTYDNLFTTIENYQNMTVAYLAHSKIGKVMKKIAALTNIPRNDDLKITDRAHALMQKWTDQIDNGKPAEAVGNGDVATDAKAGETAEGEDKPTNDAPAAEDAPAGEADMEIDGQDEKEEAAPADA